MKTTIATLTAIGALALGILSCTGAPETRPEPRAGASSGPRLVLDLVPGPH